MQQTPFIDPIDADKDWGTPMEGVLKNQNRINEIECRLSIENINPIFVSGAVYRCVRRDWNIVSAKLFVNCLKREKRALIESDLADLHWAIGDLGNITSLPPFVDANTEWLQTHQLTLRLVHPFCASWLRAMVAWDLSIARLIASEKKGLISTSKRREIVRPATMAYMGFKARAMGAITKSSSQLITEARM